jgi:hypothetical protein
MTSLPKPLKRPRKARKPILRSRPIARRKSQDRLRRTPEHVLALRADRKTADALASLLCEYAVPPRDRHLGQEAHHLLSKGAHPSVRWDLDNLVWVSREFHERVQHNWTRNELLAISRLGWVKWDLLRIRSEFNRRENPKYAVARLRALVHLRGLDAQARERGLL